jgi:hypothetical protein
MSETCPAHKRGHLEIFPMSNDRSDKPKPNYVEGALEILFFLASPTLYLLSSGSDKETPKKK